MSTNMKDKGVSEQAVRTLIDRADQCEAALTLRTKPLRNLDPEKLAMCLKALKTWWDCFNWEIRDKLADASSATISHQISELGCSGDQLTKRISAMQSSLLQHDRIGPGTYR